MFRRIRPDTNFRIEPEDPLQRIAYRMEEELDRSRRARRRFEKFMLIFYIFAFLALIAAILIPVSITFYKSHTAKVFCAENNYGFSNINSVRYCTETLKDGKINLLRIERQDGNWVFVNDVIGGEK